MVMKKRAMKSSNMGEKSRGSSFWWAILILVFKVAGIAFLAQGFIMQLATGKLYSGLVHYTIGAILGIIAWHIHKKKCQTCMTK